MTAASVETPLAPAFSEDLAQTTLAKHLHNEALTPLLWNFCAGDIPDSEHQLLLNNPELVVRCQLEPAGARFMCLAVHFHLPLSIPGVFILRRRYRCSMSLTSCYTLVIDV